MASLKTRTLYRHTVKSQVSDANGEAGWDRGDQALCLPLCLSARPPADRKKVAPVSWTRIRTIGSRSLAFHKQQGARLKLRLTYVCADTCLRGLLTEATAKHKVNRKVGQPSDSKTGSPCQGIGKIFLLENAHWTSIGAGSREDRRGRCVGPELGPPVLHHPLPYSHVNP